MGEAAAEVEEGLGGVAEAGDEGGVVGGEVDGEVEEEELPDTGVGVDVPGFVALIFFMEFLTNGVLRAGLEKRIGGKGRVCFGRKELTMAVTWSTT